MDTLFADYKDTNHKPIGNNYSLVFLPRSRVALYKSGAFIKEAEIYEQLDRRIFVIDLIEKHGAEKSKVAKVLDIARSTIDIWLKLYLTSGYKSLINSTKKGVGRKKSPQVDKEISRPTGNKETWVEQQREQEKQMAIIKQNELKNSQLEINFKIEAENICENKDIEHFNDEFEEENRYAGSFIYWTIFQHSFSVCSLIYNTFANNSMLFYLFLMMHVNQIGSIEQLKTKFKGEFGRIIGIKQLPNLHLIRRILRGIVMTKNVGLVISTFFKNQLYKGQVNLWCLYIDGHFIPYTGAEKVHKNYHTQTAKMEPGQNEIFIHDIEGKIVYFDIQEGKGDMLDVILEKSKEYAGYLGNISPLFVADKEIWGVEKFLLLSTCSRFITWEKNTDTQQTQALLDELFSIPFIVNDITYQVYETKKTYKDINDKSIELRRLVIWNHYTNKRSVAVSNDTYEDSKSLSCSMLNRWGKSENGFKHLGNRTNIHYNPYVEIEQLSKNQQASNPRYFELEKQLHQLKKEVIKIERALGRKPMQLNKNGSVRSNKSRNELQTKRELILAEIEKIKTEYKTCPAKINLLDKQDAEKYKIIETEGKKIWDFTEVIFWNTRKKLIAILKEYLPDERELIPVLEAITKCSGTIKSTKNSIEIKLEPLERPKYKQVQIQFCRRLNDMGATMDNGKKILFDVKN